MMTTGVDIIKINRIEKILSNNRESFYKKIFTLEEINYLKDRNHNPKTVAGLFAAKEAVSKCIGTGIGKVGWKDIQIQHTSRGKPKVKISNRALNILKDININQFDLSISHETEYAVAFVIGYYSKI